MRANNDTPAGEKSASGTDDSGELGAIGTPTGTIDDVYAAVDVPERSRDDARLSVKGYAYDDEAGTVVVGVGNGVSATVVLEVDEARALADAIATAAEAADREVEVE
jgi:hypothetical protein